MRLIMVATGVFLIAMLCGIFAAEGMAATMGGDARSEPRISVQFKDVTVAQAIKTLAELTSSTIKVVGPISGRQVTFNLHQVTLRGVLERILHPASFVIDQAADNRITVHILKSTVVVRENANGSATSAADGAEMPAAVSAGETNVRPPPLPSTPAVTAMKLDRDCLPANECHPSHMYPFPPADTDGKASGENDFETLPSPRTTWPQDLVAFPPGIKEDAWIAVRETHTISMSIWAKELSHFPAFPPGKLGEGSPTFGEVTRIMAEESKAGPRATDFDHVFTDN